MYRSLGKIGGPMDLFITPAMLTGAFFKGALSQAGSIAVKRVINRASNPYVAATFTGVAADAILAVYAVDHPQRWATRKLKAAVPERVRSRLPPKGSTLEELLKTQIGRKPPDAADSVNSPQPENSGDLEKAVDLLSVHWLAPAGLWLADTLLQIAKCDSNDPTVLYRAGMPTPAKQTKWVEWLSRVIRQIQQRLMSDVNLASLRTHLEFLQERTDATALVERVRDLSMTVQGISRTFVEVSPLLRTVTISLALLATIAVGVFPVVIIGGSSGRALGEIAAAVTAGILGVGPLWTRIGALRHKAHINHLARDISATWQELLDVSARTSDKEIPPASGSD
jgi:hypothetical protein